jgi:hypothetical protein
MKVLLPWVLVLLLLSRASSQDAFSPPEMVPVDLLIKTGEEDLRLNPDVAEGNYALARIHYFAFAVGASHLNACMPRGFARYPRVDSSLSFSDPISRERDVEIQERFAKRLQEEKVIYNSGGQEAKARRELEESGWRPADLPDAIAASHIRKAHGYFKRAMELAPDHGRYRLGYAALLEQALAWNKRHPQVAIPDPLRGLQSSAIRAEYLKAWELALEGDRRWNSAPRLIDIVSYEAGTAYVRLAQAARNSLPDTEAKTLERVRASLVELARDFQQIIGCEI